MRREDGGSGVSDLLVTDVVTGGRVRAATRSPEAALGAPRLAVQGGGEAGATAWWRSPAVGGGWQVQPASPRECVLRRAVPGLCGPKRTATRGTLVSGLSRDASPAALGRGCHSSRGPRRGVSGWAGAVGPPRWLLRARSRLSACPSVRPCGGGAGRRREASGQRLRPAGPRLPTSPAFPCSPPPGSGCGGEPPSLEGRILG